MKVPRKGNPHIHVHLDPVVKRFLHGYAISHDTTTAKLGRRVLAEWVHERVGSTPGGRVGSVLVTSRTNTRTSGGNRAWSNGKQVGSHNKKVRKQTKRL